METKGLKFDEFDSIKVSTKTYTATTNLIIDISKLFHIIPVTPYVVTIKKRGRKKKGEPVNHNKDVKPGSVVTVKYENEIRGVELKNKKPKPKKKKWFRNSITVVIILDKPINFKVCRNGTFQMTGCKNLEHAELCVKYIWRYMNEHTDIYSLTRGDNLEALFIPSMRNIDFSLGFLVDREKLNNFICKNKDYHCLLETSFGYTGVNIKMPLSEDMSKLEIKKISSVSNNDFIEEWTTYQEYLDLLSPKDAETKLKDDRYNTFLVFHSGKCIMSGLTAKFMRKPYEIFIGLIKKAYEDIEERLESSYTEGDMSGLSLEEELAIMQICK
tara:strand:- start:538 stop:1521 length:984 start_codon:yes stop_codon:yes gene_type:complete